MSANRIAAISTWLTGLAGFLTGILGTLPTTWQNHAAIIAGAVLQLATTLHYMTGAQKSEAIAARSRPAPAVVSPVPPYTQPADYAPSSALNPQGNVPVAAPAAKFPPSTQNT